MNADSDSDIYRRLVTIVKVRVMTIIRVVRKVKVKVMTVIILRLRRHSFHAHRYVVILSDVKSVIHVIF